MNGGGLAESTEYPYPNHRKQDSVPTSWMHSLRMNDLEDRAKSHTNRDQITDEGRSFQKSAMSGYAITEGVNTNTARTFQSQPPEAQNSHSHQDFRQSPNSGSSDAAMHDTLQHNNNNSYANCPGKSQ